MSKVFHPAIWQILTSQYFAKVKKKVSAWNMPIFGCKTIFTSYHTPLKNSSNKWAILPSNRLFPHTTICDNWGNVYKFMVDSNLQIAMNQQVRNRVMTYISELPIILWFWMFVKHEFISKIYRFDQVCLIPMPHDLRMWCGVQKS